MPHPSQLSESEKIDRTYAMLVSARRARRFGAFLRVLAVAALAGGYWYVNRPEHADLKARLLAEGRARMAEFVVPMVDDLMADVLKNMQGSGATVHTGGTPNITPEMVRAVQEAERQQGR